MSRDTKPVSKNELDKEKKARETKYEKNVEEEKQTVKEMEEVHKTAAELNQGGTLESAKVVESTTKSGMNILDSKETKLKGEFDGLAGEGKGEEDVVKNRSEASGKDAERLGTLGARLKTKEAISEVRGAEKTAKEDKEHLHRHQQDRAKAREEKDKAAKEQLAQAKKLKGSIKVGKH